MLENSTFHRVAPLFCATNAESQVINQYVGTVWVHVWQWSVVEAGEACMS